MSSSVSRLSAVAAASMVLLSACNVASVGGGLGNIGSSLGGSVASPGGSLGGGAVVGTPVALNTSGQDSCGAIDYKFLEGQPFAHTFDLQLPANSRILGRRQQADATDASRMTMIVSTSSASMAPFTANATIRRVYCG